MNRRWFLGMFGAGAVAGPKLAAGIADNIATNMPIPPMPPIGGYSAGESIKAADNGSWRLRRIAELKRIIAGKDPAVERERKMQRLYMAEIYERARLDGLRSVSPVHKQSMLMDGHIIRQARIRRADAGFELSHFLRGED
jgi:hypothetical protein